MSDDPLAGPGTVIVLTGPSSTGKTTVAELLRRQLPRPTIFLNGDDLDLPEDSAAVRTLRQLPSDRIAAMEAHFHNGYFSAMASFARHGLHTVGEVVFKSPDSYRSFTAATVDLPTLVVHFSCDREVRIARERQRSDRRPGITDETASQEWVPPDPHLAVDSSVMTPASIVEHIARRCRPVLWGFHG